MFKARRLKEITQRVIICRREFEGLSPGALQYLKLVNREEMKVVPQTHEKQIFQESTV
jgi:hypothetical protein